MHGVKGFLMRIFSIRRIPHEQLQARAIPSENATISPMTREKDPAAVALGRKRQAKMTAQERAAFMQATAEANRKRTPAERRAIARKAAMTRRRRPKWIAASNPVEKSVAAPESSTPPGIAPDDLAQLGRAIDELPDEVLEELALALAGRMA
jgi:hypothetical protein